MSLRITNKSCEGQPSIWRYSRGSGGKHWESDKKNYTNRIGNYIWGTFTLSRQNGKTEDRSINTDPSLPNSYYTRTGNKYEEQTQKCRKIFFKGIPESPWDSTITEVTDYFRDELKVYKEIQLRRVHIVYYKQTISATNTYHQYNLSTIKTKKESNAQRLILQRKSPTELTNNSLKTRYENNCIHSTKQLNAKENELTVQWLQTT